jgi:hypothetical protein
MVCLLFIIGLVASGNVQKTVDFSNKMWNCANAACSSHVSEGQMQPNYQCAEFVSRSLAAGGFIDISPNASQSAYGSFKHAGETYNLNWVSSKQGGSKGLEDLLIKLGWKNAGATKASIAAASAIFCTGSHGKYSHVAIGIGPDNTNAHNAAHYHKPSSVYIALNAIYHPA